jgi:hypothetical protein
VEAWLVSFASLASAQFSLQMLLKKDKIKGAGMAQRGNGGERPQTPLFLKMHSLLAFLFPSRNPITQQAGQQHCHTDPS